MHIKTAIVKLTVVQWVAKSLVMQIFLKLSCSVLLAALISCASAQKETPVAPATHSAHALPKGAVLAGDHPDPSLIRVGSDYWGVSTSSAWAPVYPIFHSTDLANWTTVGAVFPNPPTWAKGDYWAPEIVHFDKVFYVYYAARNLKTSKMCIGVGTAETPEGPYQDHGPILCGAIGSIDPAAFSDDNGQKYLVWKEDGNSIKKPTPLHIQKLNADGTKLVGTKTTAIINDQPWERMLVEGPFILKHGGLWYLFYSGNACCGRECNYAVGVARAKTLEGPWEKDPANPILRSNQLWKCPGHGSIAQDENGRDVFLYHAYHPTDSVYVGRQAMADEVKWETDGWPTINGGEGPSGHAIGFLGAILHNEERWFSEDFSSGKLDAGWQWPHQIKPLATIVDADGAKELSLKSEVGTSAAESLIARSITDANYEATAVIDLANTDSNVRATLAAYGDTKNAIGLTRIGDLLELWTRDAGKTLALEKIKLRDLLNSSDARSLWLKMTSAEGQFLRFSASGDGKTWKQFGTVDRDAFHLPPWDLAIRVALMSQGGYARFRSLKIIPVDSTSARDQR